MASKFYAVAVGRTVGVYVTWNDCQKQVIGYKGAKYKSFSSMDEAETFISKFRLRTAGPDRSSHESPDTTSPLSRSDFESGSNVYGDYRAVESHSVNSSTISSPLLTGELKTMSSPTIVVYTDGACSGNGKHNSVAGIGVFFGDDDPRNLSEPLPGLKQTNQRAELTAGLRALEVLNDNDNVLVKSDSTYLVEGMNDWVHDWIRKYGGVECNWLSSQNQDLFKLLYIKVGSRIGETTFEHIPAHSGIYGNEMADRLAVQAVKHAKGNRLANSKKKQ